jgi:pyridoxamine 5'-phosphate oxidase
MEKPTMVDTVLADDFTARDEPLALFQEWYEAAKLSEPSDPNAMSLSTVDTTGMPNVRMVLLKDLDRRGFTFYTNLESTKGIELLATPRAAACLHWKSLRRQIRIRGPVERVADGEADQYFATRPRQSRIGAWASAQSRPLESRFALEKAVAKHAARFALGDVPRPAHWSGFRILPVSIEFWHDRPFRLHDRLLFSRAAPGEPWTRTRLYP